MLRITINNDNRDEIRFLVEGKLSGKCVNELEKCWQNESPKVQKAILVDLSAVSFIDSCGKELLTRMYESGIRFEANGLLPKCLIEEIGEHCGKNKRETAE